MKKILLLSLLFSIFFFVPTLVLGATVEVSAQINSIQVPERSAYFLRADRPNTEFKINNTRITAVRGNDLVGKTGQFDGSFESRTKVFTFSYDEPGPYNIHLEFMVYGSYDAVCMPDCSQGGGYEASISRYRNSEDGNWYYEGHCSRDNCPDGDTDTLGFPEDNVYYDDLDSDYYWRAPSSYTI